MTLALAAAVVVIVGAFGGWLLYRDRARLRRHFATTLEQIRALPTFTGQRRVRK